VCADDLSPVWYNDASTVLKDAYEPVFTGWGTGGFGTYSRQLVRLVPNNAGFAFSGGHGAMAADAF